MFTLVHVLACVTLPWSARAAADPMLVQASSEGCIGLADFAGADWLAVGSLQAVAFHDPQPGCAPTIKNAIRPGDFFEYDDDRLAGTIRALVRPDVIPRCGRVQIDVERYVAPGMLDPLSLRSLVIDTGVECPPGVGVPPPTPPHQEFRVAVPEPSLVAILAFGLLVAALVARART